MILFIATNVILKYKENTLSFDDNHISTTVLRIHLGFVGPCIFTHSNESTN
jgi:hypothetical protein